jgi:hypothetical protein
LQDNNYKLQPMRVMLTDKEEILFSDSAKLYGIENQLHQYSEECLEAALAVRKYLRAVKNGDEAEIKRRKAELQSEIADTTIMSAQVATFFNSFGAIDQQIIYKIDRQVDRVDTAKSKRFSEPFNPLNHENQK